MKANGIRHIRTAVKHPASNGEAEQGDPGNLRQKLAQFLFTYQTTPNTVTTQTPAELFLKRQLCTILELLHPNLSTKIATKQAISKGKHDSRSKAKEFEVCDTVLVENFRGEPKWLSATVIERTGPVSSRTQVGEVVWKRQVDQMRGCDSSVNLRRSSAMPVPIVRSIDGATSTNSEQTPSVEPNKREPVSSPDVVSELPTEIVSDGSNTNECRRYPTRCRQSPDRYGFDKEGGV